MCGIAGIIALDGFDPVVLAAMTHLVSYRGPDSFGFAYARAGKDFPTGIVHNASRLPVAQPQIGLGSRRLAIVDVSPSGNQPMMSEDGEYCLTFNGEIYNYAEIRTELEAKKHRFRTRTDTEVILHAYREWGEDCLKRFNGMWAFALWDRPNQRLFCARDRFGVKPFYYALYRNRLYFASEIKQILLASGMPRTANPEVLLSFLEEGLLDHSTETFFEGIRQLPPGHSLRVGIADPLKIETRCYWELPMAQQSGGNDQDLVAEFRDRFRKAVSLRLQSDVRMGACLSGGLDSSAIVCEARRIDPGGNLHTFSACFEEKSLDERAFISAVASGTSGLGHLTYPTGEDFWHSISTMIWHQDEPVASTNVFAQWCVMSEAKKHGVSVVLTGQGGDEILCGYQKYRYFHLWRLFRSGDPRFVREALLWMPNGTRSVWTLDDASRYFPGPFRRNFSVIERIGRRELRQEARGARRAFWPGATMQERQKTDLVRTSIPSLLHYEDRNSMAHSVESRLPFLDYELAEFAVNCPPAAKLRDGWSKWILRNAMVGTVPDKVRLRRTKLGFDTPQEEWMRQGLQNGHRDLWAAPQLRMERFISQPDFVQEVGDLLSARVGRLPANALFRVICVELWARVFAVS